MKRLFAAVLTALVLPVLGCRQRVNDPADVQAIKDTQPTFDKAWNAGNAEAIASGFYTRDAIRMGPNEPALVSKEAIQSSLQKLFDQYGIEGRDVAEDVRVSGDLAVARGTFEGKSSLKAGGHSTLDKGKWVTAFERQADGSWKAFWDIYSSDLPVAEVLPLGQDELALLQIEREWAEAFLKADAVRLEKILASDWVGNSDGEIFRRTPFLADLKTGARKFVAFTNGNMRPIVFGDFAVVEGFDTEKGTFRGKDSSGKYHWIDFYIRRDGRWRCVTSYSTKVGQ